PGTSASWSIAFLPDGRLLARTHIKRGVKVRVYDPAGNPVYRDLVTLLQEEEERSLNPFVRGRTLVLQDGKRMDLLTGRSRPPLQSSSNISNFIGLPIPSDELFFAGRAQTGKDHEGHLWESLTGNVIAALPPRLPDWNIADVSTDGRLLASADETHVMILDLRESDIHRIPAVGVQNVAFSPDRKYLATALADSTVLIWEAPVLSRADWDPSLL